MSTTKTVERGSEPDADDRWAPVRDMPPSVKLVAKVLDCEDTLTQSQITEESLLSLRTVRCAPSRLEDEGMIDSRFSSSDVRKRLYTLNI